MRADRILVMKDGCIIEDGSHDDLIRLGGKYHDLWAKQILSTHTMKPLESGSRSPHKDKVDIVNDLELESNGLTHSKTEETAEGFRGRGHAVAEGSRAPKVSSHNGMSYLAIYINKEGCSKIEARCPGVLPSPPQGSF